MFAHQTRSSATSAAARIAAAGMILASVSATAVPAAATVPVDDTPTPTWRLDDRAYATQYVGDTVFVGGTFTRASSPSGQTQTRKKLAAFDAVTGQLLPFAVPATGGAVRALASDGTYLYVGGGFTSLGGQAATSLGRIDVVTGAVDSTWKVSLNSAVRALEVSDGSLYVGGGFTTVNGGATSGLVKVSTARGVAVVDPTFRPVLNSKVFGLAAGATRVYAAGSFTTANGEQRVGLAGLTTSTGANAGPAFPTSASSLAVDLSDDGTRVFLAEAGPPGKGNSTEALNTTTGERVWRHQAAGDNQAVRLYDGDVYFGFHEGFLEPDGTVDTTARMKVADASTGALQPFDPDFDLFMGVFAIDAAPQGVAIGGDFDLVSDVPAHGWALFS